MHRSRLYLPRIFNDEVSGQRRKESCSWSPSCWVFRFCKEPTICLPPITVTVLGVSFGMKILTVWTDQLHTALFGLKQWDHLLLYQSLVSSCDGNSALAEILLKEMSYYCPDWPRNVEIDFELEKLRYRLLASSLSRAQARCHPLCHYCVQGTWLIFTAEADWIKYETDWKLYTTTTYYVLFLCWEKEASALYMHFDN